MNLTNKFITDKSCLIFPAKSLITRMPTVYHKIYDAGLRFVSNIQIQCLKKDEGIKLLYLLPKYCLLSSIFVYPSLSCLLLVKTEAGRFSALNFYTMI